MFDFDHTPWMVGLIPRGRYLFVYGRASGRVDFTYFAVALNMAALYPVSIGDVGERAPEGGGFGFRGGLSAIVPFGERVELEMGISYSVVSFGLRPLSVPGRNDESGTVIDQSWIGTFGPRFWF